MNQVRGFFNSKTRWMILILILLPISLRWCTYSIILFGVNAALTIIIKKSTLSFFRKPSFWISSFLILLTLYGLLYTSDMRAGRQAVEAQLTLLVFPIIFSELGISDFEFKLFKRFYILFFLALCLFLEFRIIIMMIESSYNFTDNFFSYEYTYENLTGEYIVQPVYLGIYIVLANIFCLTAINNKLGKSEAIISLMILLFNTFFLFQLGARSAILQNLLLIGSYTMYLFYIRKKILVGIFVIISIAGVIGVLYAFSGFTRLRVQGALTEITSKNLQKEDPKSRMVIWPCALEVIQNNWILGVGTGDSESKLMDSYKKHNLIELYESKLNAHNQYLTIIMRHGLLGVLGILVSIVLPMVIYCRNKNIEAFLFTVLIAIFFLTENVLSRAQGVIFFSLFQSIFLNLIFGFEKYENTSIWNQLLSRINWNREVHNRNV
jgi:O-antigen ligase